jgi:hypothetical protein
VATEERVIALLAEANPVPDVDALPLLAKTDGFHYLAAIELKGTEMIDIEQRDTSQTKRPPWTQLSVAAVALVVLGTLGLVLFRGDGTSGGVATAERFVDMISSGATELGDVVTDDATFGPMTVPLNDDLAAFWAGLETNIRLSGCEQNAAVVRCDYEWTDSIRQAQDRPEYGALTFRIVDSRVADIARDWDPEASRWTDAGDPVIHYLLWLNESHPGWDEGLTWLGEPMDIGGGYAPLAHADPVHNAAYADALTRHLDEYRDFLSTQSPDVIDS